MTPDDTSQSQLIILFSPPAKATEVTYRALHGHCWMCVCVVLLEVTKIEVYEQCAWFWTMKRKWSTTLIQDQTCDHDAIRQDQWPLLHPALHSLLIIMSSIAAS